MDKIKVTEFNVVDLIKEDKELAIAYLKESLKDATPDEIEDVIINTAKALEMANDENS